LASNHRSDWAKLQEAVIHEREKDKRLLRTRSCGLSLASVLMQKSLTEASGKRHPEPKVGQDTVNLGTRSLDTFIKTKHDRGFQEIDVCSLLLDER